MGFVYLTEALLMNINGDGSGIARLRFQNLPPDITALYIYRSDDGKSWTKEKNKVGTSAAQGGQGTAEYENFLMLQSKGYGNSTIVDFRVTKTSPTGNAIEIPPRSVISPSGCSKTGPTPKMSRTIFS